jgi:hypothetical protein
MSILKLEDLTRSENAKYFNGENMSDYNIVEHYPWTISQNRSDVPYILLTEYEQDVSTLWTQLYYWYNAAKDMTEEFTKSNNPYKDLYHARPTKITYKLPYFQEYDHFISQTWEKNKGLFNHPVVADLLGMVGNVAKFFKAAPGVSVNQPQVWSGASNASYNIRFILFNTINTDKNNPLSDIIKNKKFKRRLQMSTLHDQRTAILASPPAIFEVKIPGIRYSPAAVINQLSVTNLGQMNLIDGENVPDAYVFDIQITELIVESRQILNDAINTGGSIVTSAVSDNVANKSLHSSSPIQATTWTSGGSTGEDSKQNGQ